MLASATMALLCPRRSLRGSGGRSLTGKLSNTFLDGILWLIQAGQQAGVRPENIMSKKPAKPTLTTAMIAEQTAEFLKAGGTIEYVGKGKSGRDTSTGSKQIDLRSG